MSKIKALLLLQNVKHKNKKFNLKKKPHHCKINTFITVQILKYIIDYLWIFYLHYLKLV